MSTMSVSTVLVAGVTSPNVVAGLPFEFLARRSIVSIYVSSTDAVTTGVVQIGGRTLFQGSLVPGTNRFPLRLEDGIVQSRGLRGERLFITFTAAGTPTVRTLIDIE